MRLPDGRTDNAFTHPSWAPTARRPTSGGFGGQRSRAAVARALYDRFPDLGRASWQRSAPTSSHGRAARSSRASSGSANASSRKGRGSSRGGARPLSGSERLAALWRPRWPHSSEHGFEPIEDAIVEAFSGRRLRGHDARRLQDRAPEQLAALGQQVHLFGARGGCPPTTEIHVGAMIDGTRPAWAWARRRRRHEQELPSRRSRRSAPHSPLRRAIAQAIAFWRRALRAIRIRGFKSFPSRSRSTRDGRRRGRRANAPEVERRRRAPLGLRSLSPERAEGREAR